MKYKLWLFSDRPVFEIGKNSISGVEFGMKSDDITQLKFNLNSQNLDLNNWLINTQTKVLLEIESYKMLFYVAKKTKGQANNYQLNLVADYYNTRYEINPLQDQNYTGKLSDLLQVLVPTWEIIQVSDDKTITISVGSDDKLATIKKAMELANYYFRISYNSNYQPKIEFADWSGQVTKIQFSNHPQVSSFGSKSIINELQVTISQEYLSNLVAVGKYDTGNQPEFDLTGYLADLDYPVVGNAVIDSSKSNLATRTEVKKFTIPENIGIGVEAKDYLYQQAREYLINHNSRLTQYKLDVSLDRFLQPLDKVFVFYNKTTKNWSGQSIERLSASQLISGVQYNLDTNKVGLTLSDSGKFAYTDGRNQIINLTKEVKKLTQST